MRILLCNFEYPPLGGGGGVATAQLAEELVNHHEVTVLTSQGAGQPAMRVENGVKVVRVPVFFRRQQATANLLSMLAFIVMGVRAGKTLLKKDEFDVINTHFALPSGPVGDALASHAGIPNVLSVHGGDLFDPSKFTSPHRHPILRAWIKRLARRADSVVGQSRNTLDNLSRLYSPDIEGVRIPLGIVRPTVEPAPRQKFGFPQDEALLVTVGRLVPRKAVDQLVAMMEAFRDHNVRLVVIGSGPQQKALEEESRRRGVADKVSFMGFVEESEKFQILQMSDIYVSTSQHEGFGLVFLEAMHCGLPVVCYDQGGQGDFLSDDETGYMVPLNDRDLFLARCRRLLDDPELRRSMGATNVNRVREFYIDNCAREYEKVFQQAVASYAGRQGALPVGSP